MPDPRAQELVDLLARRRREPDDAAVRRLVADEFAPHRLVLRVLNAQDPPPVLDQVVTGDRVHPIEGPDDLARRLAPDRRVLAVEHPDVPDRLLAFVEVALTPSLLADMPTILEGPVTDPGSAGTAIFYSINRCEQGLAGLGIPTHLLELAVARLRRDLPDLEVFSTLSPIPLLRKHVVTTDPTLADALDAGGGDRARLVGAAVDLVATPHEGRVADPVAHFHLGNGARVERIHDGADPSPRGQRRSWGVMANYRYQPEHLAARAEAYRRGEVATAPELG